MKCLGCDRVVASKEPFCLTCQRRLRGTRVRSNPAETIPLKSLLRDWKRLGFDQSTSGDMAGEFYTESHASTQKVLRWLPESLANDADLPMETWMWLDALRTSQKCYRMHVIVVDNEEVSISLVEHFDGFQLHRVRETLTEPSDWSRATLQDASTRFDVAWVLHHAPTGMPKPTRVVAAFSEHQKTRNLSHSFLPDQTFVTWWSFTGALKDPLIGYRIDHFDPEDVAATDYGLLTEELVRTEVKPGDREHLPAGLVVQHTIEVLLR